MFVSTRMQADIGTTPETREFKGLMDCWNKILKTDGPAGLYKGFSVSGVGNIVFFATYLGFFDGGKALLFPKPASHDETPLLAHYLFTYAVILTAYAAKYPFTTVSKRLMMQSGRSRYELQYTGALDCARKVVLNEGFRSLYRGFSITFFSSVFSGGLLLLRDAYRL